MGRLNDKCYRDNDQGCHLYKPIPGPNPSHVYEQLSVGHGVLFNSRAGTYLSASERLAFGNDHSLQYDYIKNVELEKDIPSNSKQNLMNQDRQYSLPVVLSLSTIAFIPRLTCSVLLHKGVLELLLAYRTPVCQFRTTSF